jgi:hypothetical protein
MMRVALQIYRELWLVFLLLIWGFLGGGALFIWEFRAQLNAEHVVLPGDPGFFGDFTGWLAFSLGALSLIGLLLITAGLNVVIARLPPPHQYIGLPGFIRRLTPSSRKGTAIVIAGFCVGLYLGHNW